MDVLRFGNVVIDSADGLVLCDFYHQLLGWEKTILFGWPAVRSENGVIFLFATEPDYVPPVWPEETGNQQKQMHFDFQVPDVAAAVERAKTLGAATTEKQFGGEAYVTLLDPAGHPFCLCHEGNSPL